MIASLRWAVGLLTILPVGGAGRPSGRSAASGPAARIRPAAWFPVVGLALGALVAIVDHGAALLFPPGLRAAVTLGAWILLTGALHLDGWIDVCDAMAPGLSGPAALRALEDPRAGALGVVGGTTLLLVKHAALTSLGGNSWRPLLLVTASARWGVVLLLFRFPYARGPEGLGWSVESSTGRMEAMLATATVVAVGILVEPGLALVVAVTSTVTALGLGRLLHRRLGGLTGDAYGAAVELTETVAMVAAVAVDLGGGA